MNNSSRVISARKMLKFLILMEQYLKQKKLLRSNLNNALILNNYIYSGKKFNEEENFLRIAAKK